MEMSRRLINLIGSSVVAVVVLMVASLLVVVPSTQRATDTTAQAELAADSDQVTRAELAELAKQEVLVPWLQHDLDLSLRDGRSPSGRTARRISFGIGGRQVLWCQDRGDHLCRSAGLRRPTGTGVGDDGTPTAPQATPSRALHRLQLPVTFEVEVSSTAQAAAFLDGLRAGPRLLQVVQAQSSATNDAKRFTVTVDALIFSARG